MSGPSGRWRSRHWERSSEADGNDQQQQQQYHPHKHTKCVAQDRWGGVDDKRNRRRCPSNHGYSTSRDGVDYHVPRPQYQRSSRPQSRSRSSPNASNSDDRHRKEWKRGEPLPARGDSETCIKSNHPSSSSSRENSGPPPLPPSSFAVSPISLNTHSTFSAPAAQGAWGNAVKSIEYTDNTTESASPTLQTDDTESKTTSAVASVKTGKRGWEKSDSHSNRGSASEMIEKRQVNTNAFMSPNSSMPRRADGGSFTVINSSKTPPFPTNKKAPKRNDAKKALPWIAKRENGGCKEFQSSAKPWPQIMSAPRNDDVREKSNNSKITLDDPAFFLAARKKPAPTVSTKGATENAMLIDENTFPPVGSSSKTNASQPTPTAASLPPTSLWGKGKMPSSSSEKMIIKKTPKKGLEFPSLSVASKMSPRLQGERQQPLKIARATIPTEDKSGKEDGNKRSAKKSSTNIASLFVSPGVSALTATSGSQKGSKKKHLAPQKKTAKKGNDTSTINLKFHPTLKSHPGMANMVSLLGVKRSSPSSSIPGSRPHHEGGEAANMPFHFSGGSHTAKGVTKKGRQRLAPRKKKLTTLKKRVLQERLKMWKETNEIAEDVDGLGADRFNGKRLKTITENTKVDDGSTTLLVENFIQPNEDDLADDDEYDEIVSNLISLAGRIGKVLSVFIPRSGSSSDYHENSGSADTFSAKVGTFSKGEGLAFVRYASNSDACTAKDALEGMVVGGHKIRTTLLNNKEMAYFNDQRAIEGTTAGVKAPSVQNDCLWRRAVLKIAEDREFSMSPSCIDLETRSVGAFSAQHQLLSASASTVTIVFHKILCDDDYEDKEALEESIKDIKGLAQQYGPVEDIRAVTTEGDDQGNVYVCYKNYGNAETAVRHLNGILIGGSNVTVNLPGELILHNLLNEDDFEDKDCFLESMEDIRKLTLKHGRVGRVHADLSGEHKGRVRVLFLDGQQTAHEAALKLNGMLVGGVKILASVATSTELSSNNKEPLTQEIDIKVDPPPALPPMYSGDKIIPGMTKLCLFHLMPGRY